VITMTRILPMAVLMSVSLLPATRAAVRTGDDPDIPAPIDFDAAARAATAIPHEFQRGKLLFEIGIVRAQAGDRASSQALFRQGTEHCRKAIDALKDEGRKGYLYVQLAELQRRAGDRASAEGTFARAVAAAETITQENIRFDLLQFLARTQAEAGDLAGALATTRALSFSGMHVDCLVDIAKGQAKAGDVASALETAAKVRAMGSREKTRKEANPQVVAYYELMLVDVLAEVALARARSGEPGVADARETIRDALSLVDRSLTLRPDVGATALAGIALAQARLGDREGSRKSFGRALAAASSLETFLGAEVLAKIAQARRKAGETPEARVILRKAFERTGPHKTLFTQVNDIITQVQLEAGDLDGALQTARASRDDQGEIVLYPGIFRQLVRAHAMAIGPRAALAEWLKSARSPLLRAYAILGAAEAAAALANPNP
jgi:tetratricopeptide (TPR) repeat protein